MLRNGLSPRQQGDLGEVSALEWFVRHGAWVFLPVGHSPDYDLVADFGDGTMRVQVKTTTYFRDGRWIAMLATSGGNQSWTGVVKTFDRRRCDVLFVLAGDGRRWLIPSSVIEGGRTVLLGGPKYAAFEVESTTPITRHAATAR